MTCIVGYIDKKNKKVIMGGDSAAIAGLDLTIRKDNKVFNNGDFVIGCTSSFRMIQLLQYSFKPPEIKTKNIHQYMCTDFINEVRKCFQEGGFLQKYTDGDEKGGTFLVGYKNKLFKIDNDFQVAENINGYDSIGCGDDYALGSLYILNKTSKSPIDIVLLALNTASYFSAGVSKPFIIKTS